MLSIAVAKGFPVLLEVCGRHVRQVPREAIAVLRRWEGGRWVLVPGCRLLATWLSGHPLRLCQAGRHFPVLAEAFGMLAPMEERELHVPAGQPLIGWRLFRARRSESGFVLSAPLIHNPGFERFPSGTIDAICYQAEHPAPAPGCRCGLYAALEGTLDSLSGYLSDSAHDHDPPIYAEVACTGRVFVDVRGARAQRIEVLRLATSASLWPDPGLQAQAVTELRQRYRVEVCGLGVVPQWVVANVMPQGAPPEDAAIDLDALLGSLGRRSPDSR